MAYQIKKDPISKIPKVQLAFWLLVRLAMLICAGYSFIHGDTVMGFESIFCFIFTHLWDLFQIFGNGSFIEEVPPLSQTLLNIIIFIGIVFGSYLELFDKLAHFDDFMHLLSGFVCAAFGFDFARIIQRKKGPCAVTLAAIFGLMFAVTIAAGWEFYEFLMDTLHGTNLQLAKAGPETAMFDLAKAINVYYNDVHGGTGFDKGALEKAGKAFKTILDILGILEKEWKKTEAYDDKDYNDLMNVILSVRQSARKAKQYQLADEIRDKLGEIGIVIEDTPTGARWKKRGV